MGPRRRMTPELGIHGDIFRLACLYWSAVPALTWSQLPVRWGGEMYWTSGAEQRLCASNENREGAQGWNATPKRKIYLPDREQKEVMDFSSKQPSPPLLSCFDSALTPFFWFVFLVLVPFSIPSPPTDSGFLWVFLFVCLFWVCVCVCDVWAMFGFK